MGPSGGSSERWYNQQMAYILTGVSAAGALLLIYGLVILGIWAVIAGMAITIGGKIWFVDRMVWLYEDMKAKTTLDLGD